MRDMTLRFLVLSIAFWFSYSLAQEDGFVQEDIHVHGAALLNIALDGEDLFMEFISPAINIVGFEYQPGTDEEREAVANAILELENAADLFVPAPDARCALLTAVVESEIAEEDEHEHAEGEEHEEGEEHAEEGEEHAEHEEGEEEAHSAFHATYTFTCSQPSRLTSIDLTTLFEAYPGLEDLDVQYALPSGQGAQELNPASTRLAF